MSKKIALVIAIVMVLSMSICPIGDCENVYAATKPGKVKRSSIVASNVTFHSMTISWSKAKNAKSYKIRYRKGAKNAWVTKSVSSCKLKIPNMLPNRSYQVQINSVNGLKSSGWTKTKSFKTKKSTYTKTKTLKDTQKRIVTVGDMGKATVFIYFNDYEYYKDKKGYRKCGYRCYNVSFKSSCNKAMISELKSGSTIGYLRHYVGSKEKKSTPAYQCIHDNITSGSVYQQYSYDSAKYVSHKLKSSDKVKLGWMINLGTKTASGTFVFSNIAK